MVKNHEVNRFFYLLTLMIAKIRDIAILNTLTLWLQQMIKVLKHYFNNLTMLLFYFYARAEA